MANSWTQVDEPILTQEVDRVIEFVDRCEQQCSEPRVPADSGTNQLLSDVVDEVIEFRDDLVAGAKVPTELIDIPPVTHAESAAS